MIDANAQPARARNVEAIVDYFKSGIKDVNTPGALGVEVEHFVVTDNLEPVAYSQEHGVRWILEQLSSDFPDITRNDSGSILGVAKPSQAVTIEPAAQLELSAGPYEAVGEIRIEFEQFQRKVSHLLQPHGLKLVAVGYHPTATASELELIPKQRYKFMDEHFQQIGPYGRRMMRGTAATQISIDYYSESDCLSKMRVASALSPLFALLCDNASVFEGAPRPHRMMRTEIWRECDPARCGIVPDLMDPSFTLEDYANYILDTPAIFKIDDDGSSIATDLTFGELYASSTMSTPEVEHALSMFFNDVRLKRYIEIRPADSMPIPFVTAYAALIKGLFYDRENLNHLIELTASIKNDDIEQAKRELTEQGFDAVMYDMKASELALQLFEWAHDALASNERNYLSPLNQLARVRRTLADMAS
ncbi:MAG: glutamate--cysteine ligase [Eggerthellaceae bacterium]|nr:glutamate--cysteine ligase [Eggerthellaceae bacterium]